MKKLVRMCSVFAVVSIFASMLTGHAQAQTFTTLYDFTNGTDGADPFAGLLASGNTLYGTTRSGGTGGSGSVYKINTDGSGFTAIYDFSAPISSFLTNTDGANPLGGLVLSGNTLYGTAANGGGPARVPYGDVFAVNTDGTDFTNLLNFRGDPAGGAYPDGTFILAGNVLYGTTSAGGPYYPGAGTVFAIHTDGTANTILHSFTFYDGANPAGMLVLSGGVLYGVTPSSKTTPSGSIYELNTNGTGFSNIYNFSALSGTAGTNSDGAGPSAGLVLLGNTLYGTTPRGGAYGKGTLFSINTDGTAFTSLYSFSDGLVNGDGGSPVARLMLVGNTLYGTTQQGGTYASGTIFSINPDGTGFTTVHSFSGSLTEGGFPTDALVQVGNTLYGTAYPGSLGGFGSIFSLNLTPVVPQPNLTLGINPANGNVVLSWPVASPTGVSFSAYVLQSATMRGPSANWSNVLSAPSILNGNFTVSDPMSGSQKFYRLVQ